MKPKLLLRIAAGFMIFHMIGHTLGHLHWREAAEPKKQEVIRQMTDHEFPFMGKERSMGDYYEGYGWTGTITLILMAVILWIVSGAASKNKDLSVKIILTVAISLAAWCVIEFLFFFPFAAGITLLAATCTFISAWQLKTQKIV